MSPYPIEAPLVVLYNYLETFREFLTKSGDETSLMSRRFNGDQALYWLNGEKFLITSVPIENFHNLTERWNYNAVTQLSPKVLSAQLSHEVMRDPAILDTIENAAGDKKAVTIVSYAATSELHDLVDFLQQEKGIQVLLPETSSRNNLWLKDYIDSKAGFRELAQRWVGETYMPEGYITSSLTMLSEIARYFAQSGRGIVVKENIGGSGVGNIFFAQDEILKEDIEAKILAEVPQNSNTTYVIEEFIHSTEMLSPSLEFYVPEIGKGEPQITYVCNQHFADSGRFAGVIIAEELYHEAWYPELEKVGSVIAVELQKMGYVGHFDLDSIIDDEGRLYLLEINSRRTGGTYVHEFLTKQFGVDYSKKVAAFSQNKIKSKFTNLESLENELSDLLYHPRQSESGVIILLTSELSNGYFGYLILGKSVDETLRIRAELEVRTGKF